MPPTTPSVVAELLLLLKERDVRATLHAALLRMKEASNAEVGVLDFFGSAELPTRVQTDPLPDPFEAHVKGWTERWETLPAPLAMETLADSGQGVVEVALPNTSGVVGRAALLLPPGAALDPLQEETVRIIGQVAGYLGALLQDLSMTQLRLERLSLLHDIGQALASTRELHQLLQDIMQLSASVMNAGASTLMLMDPNDPGYLVFEIAHGTKRDELRRFRMPITEGIAGWVATNGVPVVSNHPGEDMRFSRKVDLRTGFLTRNILCVPMQLKGVTIGVLQVLNKVGRTGFDNDDLELLLTLASQAAIAIDNARLYRNLREEQERIIAAQEEVRRELARNLHDGTVQSLAAMSMGLEHARRLMQRNPQAAAAELEELLEMNGRAMREARTLLFELRPVILETQGLWAALQTYVERLNIERAQAAPVQLALPEALPLLSTHVARTLFAIIQEAVGNARKHARASRIIVRARQLPQGLEVAVEDDGIGFDPAVVQARYETSGSLGMLTMRERTDLIGAEWRLQSVPGKGTQVLVRVPSLER